MSQFSALALSNPWPANSMTAWQRHLLKLFISLPLRCCRFSRNKQTLESSTNTFCRHRWQHPRRALRLITFHPVKTTSRWTTSWRQQTRRPTLHRLAARSANSRGKWSGSRHAQNRVEVARSSPSFVVSAGSRLERILRKNARTWKSRLSTRVSWNVTQRRVRRSGNSENGAAVDVASLTRRPTRRGKWNASKSWSLALSFRSTAELASTTARSVYFNANVSSQPSHRSMKSTSTAVSQSSRTRKAIRKRIRKFERSRRKANELALGSSPNGEYRKFYISADWFESICKRNTFNHIDWPINGLSDVDCC